MKTRILLSAAAVAATLALMACASNPPPSPDTTEQDLRVNKANMMDNLDAQK
jgi:ABC-type oligopeptide transport system substrate-binding subunit